MLDEKSISEIRKRMERHLKEGLIVKEKDVRFVQFFLDNARNSLESANLLYEASVNQKVRNSLGLSGFNGFLWVINSGYYSMFYIARALLESEGVKIKTDYSVHALTFDALVYYFHLNGKIERKLIEEFADAELEASETLGKEKAKELMDDYFYEKRKRSRFTYELGETAMHEKAKTSLERAKRFNEEMRKILGR